MGKDDLSKLKKILTLEENPQCQNYARPTLACLLACSCMLTHACLLAWLYRREKTARENTIRVPENPVLARKIVRHCFDISNTFFATNSLTSSMSFR